MLTASTLGSTFDTLLAVYRGNSVGSLTEVAANDDSAFGGTISRLETFVAVGTTYQIAVDGYSGDSGTMNLQLDFIATAAAPANDDFAAASTLNGLPVNVAESNLGATLEAGEPMHAGNIGGRSVWWRWTAPTTGPVTVNTDGSDFDTLLSVYQGTIVSNLTRIAFSDDGNPGNLTSSLTLTAIAGEEYLIAVDGYASLDRIPGAGTIQLNLNPFSGTPPANDNFSNAETIPDSNFNLSGSTHGATSEPNEPTKAFSPPGASVWWNFSVPMDTLMEIDTYGSDFDTVLAVFTGSALDNLALVIANDDATSGSIAQSTVSFIARANVPYRIALDGFNGQIGDFELNFTQVGLAANQYRTDFENSGGFTAGQALGGQGGWLGSGGDVHTIRASGFTAYGQAGAMGGLPSNGASEAAAWHPVNVNPPNAGIIRFRTDMQIVDSTNDRFDEFSWRVENQNGELLFAIAFDNSNLNIERLLDNNAQVPSGWRFQNDLPFRLELVMDLTANLWVAYYDEVLIIPASPITTQGRDLNLGSIRATWKAAAAQDPGDNRMEFDNYAVDHIAFTLPPGVESTTPSSTVTEGTAFTLSVSAHGPGTLSYQWLFDGSEIPGATEANLVLNPALGSDSGEYVVRVSNEHGSIESDPIFLEVIPAPMPPPNDHFVNATTIGNLPYEEYTSNDQATREPSEPLHGTGGDASIWWQWTAPATGRYAVSTLGSSFDTVLAVYQGHQLNNLSFIASNDDFQSRTRGSLITFDAVAGTNYRFAVDGLSGSSGNVRFALTPEEAPQLDSPGTAPNGDFSLNVNPPPGVTYILQSSADLKIWTNVTTITGANNATQFTDSTAAASGRFYRLVREQ
ncbi:MAG: immunoglobulin domain-containing protein [Limisphaerales bacterium]